jgi:multidrug efflux pump subunit AcrA (membrane-fusion protein)
LGRQDLAKRDYEQLEKTISDEYKTLVLRKPQLDTARAGVEAAEAAVRQAQLDLERTRIRAPFAAHILSREANVGSQVAPGQALGHLVGIESYWVEATVPVADLRWIDFPQDSGAPDSDSSSGSGPNTGSVARIRNRAAWPDDTFRTGRVHRLIGALESPTRLARVLLTVADPLAHEPGSAGQPPLMVGSFVEAQIEGKPIEDVIRMDRDYLRQNDTVWVNEGGVLGIHDVEVVFRDKQFAYIGAGLNADDRVVTTNLANVVEGASLRLAGAAE